MRKDIVRDTPSLEEFCEYIERERAMISTRFLSIKSSRLETGPPRKAFVLSRGQHWLMQEIVS